MARLSASPIAYRRLIPQQGENPSDREEWTRALYWLVSHDLVIQSHDHYRIIITREVKEKAWKELQKERLLKKLEKEKQVRRRASLSVNSAIGAGDLQLSESQHIGGTENDSESSALSEDDFGEGKNGEDFFSDLSESFIQRPGSTSSAENRCLQIIMQDKDEEKRRRFAM